MTEDEDFIVTAKDCQQIGFCGFGIKRWLESHGCDMKTFLKEGMPASKLTSFDDAFGDRAVEQARKRVTGG